MGKGNKGKIDSLGRVVIPKSIRNALGINHNDEIKVSVKLKNIGKLDGEEVVQLYIKDVKSDKWMAIKQLRKFDRIALKKGEEKTIKFKLEANEDLRYYDSKKRSYMVESGDFEIQIGASSEDIRLRGIVRVEK